MTPLVRARWTDRIHQEWIENLLANRPDLSRERLEETRDKMNKLPDCLISDYEGLEHSLELKDPNDRHILAAAIQGGAQAIVTYNLSDFPESQLAKHHIEALHPDEFLMGLVDLDTKSRAECRSSDSWKAKKSSHGGGPLHRRYEEESSHSVRRLPRKQPDFRPGVSPPKRCLRI